eukprot:CAMPEP_0113670350 /NCGR_PEP_ID=MMETSP0038_2-20120614/5089_1 /TAXON_ID=2898 /ORGANISM="Cryptomonas paramecium" /LENGTH=98 /DNA_ID=CAMNT_0000586359 /DNA_START=17 /DNA_END=309 /DNA_ORIENTATION=- /assembly_acc=CAM_ASM_000170
MELEMALSKHPEYRTVSPDLEYKDRTIDIAKVYHKFTYETTNKRFMKGQRAGNEDISTSFQIRTRPRLSTSAWSTMNEIRFPAVSSRGPSPLLLAASA